MIKDIKHEGNILIIVSDKATKTITLDQKIWEILKFEDSVVVMTAHDHHEGARNIHRYAEDGTKIWTVEEPESVKGQANAFTGLWLDKNGNLMGGTWQGCDHWIDFDTGKILTSEFTK